MKTLKNVKSVMSIYAMCLQAVWKGALFIIRKYCVAFIQSFKRKSRKSLFKGVNGKTPIFKCWLSSWFLELKGKKQNIGMEIVHKNCVLRSLYSMQITGVLEFITIVSNLCTASLKEPSGWTACSAVFHMSRSCWGDGPDSIITQLWGRCYLT